MILQPGIHLDVPAADYFADCAPQPSLTQSIAKVLIKQSAAHARLEHPRLAPQTDDDDEPAEKYVAAQAIGNAAHAVMIGRSRDIAEGEFPNWMSKAAKEFKADAAAGGKLVILSKHLKRARMLVAEASVQLEAAARCPGAPDHTKAFRDGHGEVVLVWREGDVWFRSMVDWMVNTAWLYDLKTSAMSCSPHDVIDRPSMEGWDIQAAMHERGLDVLDPDNAGRRQHYYIAVENYPPYGLTPVRISEADLTMGRKKLEYAITVWGICMSRGEWPCYPAQTITSEPRGYTESKWLEREIKEAARERQPREVLESLMGG